MQKIAILKAANKKSSLKRPIWDAIYSRRKNKIRAHGLKGKITLIGLKNLSNNFLSPCGQEFKGLLIAESKSNFFNDKIT